MISKITLQQLCRQQRLDRGAYGTFKEVQEAMVLPSKEISFCQDPAFPHPRAQGEKGAEAEGKVGVVAMQLEEKL